MFLYYILALAALAVSAAAGIYSRKFGEKAASYVQKGLALCVMGLFFFRYLAGEYRISDTQGLNMYSPFGSGGAFLTLISTLVIWATLACEVLIITYPWFSKKVTILNQLIRYFAFPVYLAAFATLFCVVRAMDGELAETYYWRDIVYALEIGFSLGLTLSIGIGRESLTAPKSKWWKVLICVLGFMICSLPDYAVQVLYGYANETLIFKDLSPEHRIMLYGMIVIPLILHFSLSRFSEEKRRYALLVIALGTMISYTNGFTLSDLGSVREWPLHLCNTAMYIIALCLAFRWEKLYYFTLFINVLGALFAMLMPNYDEINILSSASAEFWMNHYCAFFMPILIMSLRIFKRPKFKEFLFATIAFTVYFLFILFANAWFVDTDFFFVNSDFIAEKAGQWAEDLRDKTAAVTIGSHTLTFYPIYQILFYLTYDVLALAVWFVYEQFFEIADLYSEMVNRNRKIKADRLALEVALGGRSIKEPVNMDGVNQLILRDFCKKYSTSDVYAVKNANLEVNGGEIFGFLGPNGAGKSTIIKSVVGIQTVTSGAIEVCGYDVEKQSVSAKMQIGFVPDHYALYENLTGREYVNYIADLYGVSKEDRTARIDDMVERFHLQGSFENQMKTYSHGMKQKITIMSALVHNPKLWILDEPLTGLDPESIFQVKECMKAHAKAGNIVFFSSHIIDVVERICDRIAIIKKGNILCTKTVAEIEASGESLEHFYMRMIGEIPDDSAEAASSEIPSRTATEKA